MTIFTYPDNAGSFARLQSISSDLNVPAPLYWTYKDLNTVIKDLVLRSSKGEKLMPESISANVSRTGIPAPVIVFAQVPTEKIYEFIRAYKSNGEWPVFAVLTQASLEMSLATLIEQLLEDRCKEEECRKSEATKTI